ncbi:MAG: NUDIX hydrolase [Gemmatimonadota bacterium]|nr:NUDIX hydrolase [Gemmatimonadota bacterium]
MPRATDGDGPRGDDGSPRRGAPAPYDIPEERLPPGFIETLDNVPATPAVPHPSATVVLMREGGEGPEVLLLRRNRATGFVPGAYVFPGGRVDAADGEDALAERWDGLTRGAAAGRLGIAPDADPPAIAYYGAALREAVEETGLLAGVVAVHGPPRGEVVREAREALLGGGASFAAVLRKLGARLDGGAVEYIAHWVTPEVEPRRYDTRFFAARVPAGSKAVYDRREMTDAVWLTPGAALDRHRSGRLPMIFPTIRTLEDLCDFGSVDELLGHYRARAIKRVQPTIVRTATGVRLRVP